LYPELASNPNPTTTSKKEIFKMQTHSSNYLSTVFEIDRQTANRCLKDVPPDAERTKGRPEWKISTFAKSLEAHHLRNTSNANDGATGSDSNSDTASLISARIRVANANAESKERTNAVARGEFADIATAVDLFGLSMGVMRETMLTMPGKLSDTLTAYCAEDRIKIFEILYAEVVAALTALSSPETYTAAGVAYAQRCEARDAPPIADESSAKAGDRDE
jgi:hypothetical protein